MQAHIVLKLLHDCVGVSVLPELGHGNLFLYFFLPLSDEVHE